MTTLKTLTILFLIGLTACNSVDKKSAHISSKSTNVQVPNDIGHLPKARELYKKTPQQIEEEREQDILDSINMVHTLEFALEIVNGQISKDSYTLESDTLDIRYGHIFSYSVKHLIIKRTFLYGINTDVYKLQDNRFVKICFKNINHFEYIGDTIQDVNGDGRVDYLLHCYPMSGCCLRDIYEVYLQKPNGDFAEEIEFINPNFSIKDKTIRGLRYGNRAPLYKYKWNRYKVDTIEYIYFPDSTNGNHFIQRKHEDENEKGKIIRELPDEYKKIGFGND